MRKGVVARMKPTGPASGRPDGKLREIRGKPSWMARPIPDYASLHPGYKQDLYSRGHLRLCPHAEQVADRKDQVGAVHRVEMEIRHATIDEVHDLLGRDRRGD